MVGFDRLNEDPHELAPEDAQRRRCGGLRNHRCGAAVHIDEHQATIRTWARPIVWRLRHGNNSHVGRDNGRWLAPIGISGDDFDDIAGSQ
jgi:hypothetical protein